MFYAFSPFSNCSFMYMWLLINANNLLKTQKKLPSVKVRPTTLTWLITMTLTFNPVQAMVMTYSPEKFQGQWSVSSEDTVEICRRTNRRMEATALPPSLMRLMRLVKMYTQQVFSWIHSLSNISSNVLSLLVLCHYYSHEHWPHPQWKAST